MKKYFYKLIIVFLFSILTAFPISSSIAYANDNRVYLGGFSAGFSIETKGAEVIGINDVLTENGLISPSKNAGIEVGDVIYSIGGFEVNNSLDIEKSLYDCNKKIVLLYRNGECITTEITPAKEINGKIKIGVFIRDNITGIGTITFIKNDKFASLGHPILSNNNTIQEISKGNLYKSKILGIKKGEKGIPGELKGSVLKNYPIGNITKNISSGVYGNINDNFNKKSLIPIEIGVANIGKASIVCDVSEYGKKEYDISIIKVDTLFQNELKNYVIKIEDKDLIELTGGIIQGMSGSPILQNGKLVGAVTHVFINDPIRGYGISINNMLKELN